MGKLLIEPKTKFLIENSPEKFTKETINLYNKAVNEAEQSDEYTIIGVDLATKDFGDCSVVIKAKIKDGEYYVLENVKAEDYVELHFPCDNVTFNTNESYTTKGGKVI